MFLVLACAPSPEPEPTPVEIPPMGLGLPAPSEDDDGDGYTEEQQDCDDADAAIGPFAEELPGDGVDQDCDHSDASPALLDEVSVAWTGGPAAYAGGALLLADVDGVRGLDLVVGSSGAGTVSVLRGEGGPVEDAATVWTTEGVSAGPLAAGDLDGDGRLDLVVGEPSADGTEVNQAGAVYGWTAPVAGTMDLSAAAVRFEGDAYAAMGGRVCAGDWDGDGIADVAAHSTSPAEMLLFLGGDPEPAARLARDTDVYPSACLSSDLDGDGREDLVVSADRDGADSEGLVSVFLSVPTGDATLLHAPVVLHGSGRNGGFGTAIAAGDTDGDGADDLVVGTSMQDVGDLQDAGEVSVFRSPLPATGTPDDAPLRIRGEAAWLGLGRSLALFEVGDRAWLAASAGYVTPDGQERWPRSSLFLLGVSGEGESTTASAAAVFTDGLVDPAGALLAAGDLDGDDIDELVVADRAATSADRPDGNGVIWRVDVASMLVGE